MNRVQEKLSTRQLNGLAQVEALYKTRLREDFPRNERKPLSSIRRAWRKGAYTCFGLFDGEEILGYAFFVRRGNNYLLDYLAIARERRDEGLGSLFLEQLAACLVEADCVAAEVEDPDKACDGEDKATRERRLRFYLRSGYRETELRSRVFGADFRVLERPQGKRRSREELRQIYTELYQSVLPRIFLWTRFRIW